MVSGDKDRPDQVRGILNFIWELSASGRREDYVELSSEALGGLVNVLILAGETIEELSDECATLRQAAESAKRGGGGE